MEIEKQNLNGFTLYSQSFTAHMGGVKNREALRIKKACTPPIRSADNPRRPARSQGLQALSFCKATRFSCAEHVCRLKYSREHVTVPCRWHPFANFAILIKAYPHQVEKPCR